MNQVLIVLSFVSVVLSVVQATCSSSCLIDTPFGKIQGKPNNGMCSFTNVPYAQAPIGTKRFNAPVPYTERWSEVRDGTQEPIGCVQFTYNSSPDDESENCLFVNIHIPCSGSRATYPVRAYIHGGGFMFGQAGDTDPSRIVEKDMIVVTIGYRLGAFGFLSTGDSCIPGNNGLKDQREALRWIKKYIRYFNGDPNKVLLSGFSAGGASTHLHVLRKEKLFNAAMANNGVAFNPWVFQTKPYAQFAKFVANLGCSPQCATVKDCLRRKSVQEIFTAVDKMKEFRDNPFNVFGVVVESPSVCDAFITEPPEDIIKSGKTSNVPFLIAYTEREGSYTAADWMHIGDDGRPLISLLNDKTWLKFAPLMLFYNNTLPAAFLNQRSIELRKQYLGDKPFTVKNYRQLEDMFTDVLYVNGVKKAVCLHRKYSAGKLYVYEYKYPHKSGVGNLISGRTDVAFGADHGADGLFTLPLSPLKQDTLAPHELRLSNSLCELYKSLADGNAIYDGTELPINTPLKTSKLTINEYCHNVEYCSDAQCGDCSKFE